MKKKAMKPAKPMPGKKSGKTMTAKKAKPAADKPIDKKYLKGGEDAGGVRG